MIQKVLILLALAIASSSALLCLSCDSAIDSYCGYLLNETLTVPVVPCDQGFDKCHTSNIDPETNRIIRGCYDPSIFSCAELDCFLCDTNSCNDIQLIEEKCVSCVSDPTNTHCEWDVATHNEPIVCPETTADRAGCFLQIKDNQYTRGCVASLDVDEYQGCVGGQDCKICQGNNCNSKEEFQRCYTCDSESDENCVYRPNGAYIKTCAKYDDTCIAFAVANGKTGRGCATEVDTEPTFCPGTNCVECSSVECNSVLVPSYRVTCYQCDDTQFGCTYDQGMFKSFQRACKNFNYQDQCYTYKDEKNQFYRGCMSDNSEQSLVCAANPDKCTTCAEHDCNSAPLLTEPELTCHKCVGEECMVEAGLPVVKCQAQVQPGEEETCYYAKLVGGAIRMGCSLDEASVCSGIECLKCKGNNCNSVYIPKKNNLICHKCLDDDEGCPWRQKEAEAPVYCELMLLYGEVDSCYYYKYANGDVRRGCLKDDRFFCYGHDCKTCTGNYCNAQAETQSCIQCNSAQELFATCGEDAKDLNATPCEEDAYLEEVGCYSIKIDGLVTRGCWNDATQAHKAICLADADEHCDHCLGDGCNTKDHSGSAHLIVASSLILLSAMVTLFTQ